MSTFAETLGKARDLLDRGSFQDAFNCIVDVKVSRPDQLFEKIALMADAGVALRDLKILKYGRYLMEHHSRDILAVPAYAPFHWFNLGSLQCNILALWEYEEGYRHWYDRRLTVPARAAYEKAAASIVSDSLFKSRIFSAHGRLLVGLGRDREAFELFHKATGLDPGNDDAELGRLETLAALAGTAPALERDLLMEAGGRLALLGKSNDSLRWSGGIHEVKAQIAERLGTSEVNEPSYPQGTVTIDSDRGHKMVMFNLQHRLYLSPCAVCRKCDRAIGDAAVIGANHAMVGGKIADRYRRMALLVGRLTERYRALRAALFNHYHAVDVPDGSGYQPHLPAVEGWRPLHTAAAALISTLSGAGALMEGIAACAALYLEREVPPPVRMEHILGTPASPSPALKEVKNPALHAFWDLWADGVEGLVPGIDLVRKFGDSLSSPQVENLSRNNDLLTECAMSFIEWSGKLIFYLVRMADRDARGDTENPPLWPLSPFMLPTK